jgi:hypothetical protein
VGFKFGNELGSLDIAQQEINKFFGHAELNLIMYTNFFSFSLPSNNIVQRVYFQWLGFSNVGIPKNIDVKMATATNETILVLGIVRTFLLV